ncbi:serine/threonine protein kinase [Microcoleus sp. FACHB-SPT15]|uniref:serine/threonine-protein kinase n=1 Tax=Microcoleus sp. FACHB-SPT15 TaxID=2692830 RepID=UPI0017833C55|nr:serine/threonine-protein kinase [Microcoleus sp. FACHB-SPT15]MBD1809827.1 serine/threonine protein kinase [Microcoleus sp. FACHB-SPT15]
MSYCLNLRCPKPQNPNNARFCSTCGSRLLLGDRYRALELISQGGVGRTFLAVDEQAISKLHCIIKQFSPKNQGTNNPEKAAELFHQEATRLQVLGQHPQIPQLLAYFEPDNLTEIGTAPAIVQTLITGQSLAQKLASEGAFSEVQIRQILNDILPVLQFVHEQGVIHRDINPNNIIRRTSTPFTHEEIENDEGQLVLVDFNAAKFTTKTALARTGTVIGSAAYTAQEQLMGKAVSSSDWYSLGVTCIHLLTDIHPFDLFNSLEGIWVWQDYLTNPVSKELSQILNKMLDSVVRRRYQSAAEILQVLNPQGHTTTIPVTLNQPSSSQTLTPKSIIPIWTCVRTLTGHTSSINSIAFSPDGQTFASGSADKNIKIWKADSHLPCCTFSGHLSLINAVAFSPEGRQLASGSWDYTIKLWDVETEELIDTLREHSGWIHAVAISSDGKTLASGSADKSIKLWNLKTKEVQASFWGHSGAIQALAFSPTGQILASGSVDKTIKIWDISHGIQLTIEGHLDTVNSLTFSPSGRILISGSADKTIKIWNLGDGALLNTVTGHLEAVNSLALNTQGNTLISASADKTLKIWHPSSGKLLHTLSGHQAGVTAVAMSPDSRIIASGSQDKTIKIWQFN